MKLIGNTLVLSMRAFPTSSLTLVSRVGPGFFSSIAQHGPYAGGSSFRRTYSPITKVPERENLFYSIISFGVRPLSRPRGVSGLLSGTSNGIEPSHSYTRTLDVITSIATCDRCDLPLDGWKTPIDCRMCDRICPVWGTHGHLWNGNEDESQAAYETEQGN